MTQSNGILSTLVLSEKRKEILFLLQKKPSTLTDVKDYFHVKTPEIHPRLKELEAKNLVVKNGDFYSLTRLGNILANYYRPFLDTIAAIEANEEFWNDHDISAIPEELLDRIQELKECKTVKTEDYNICEPQPTFIEYVTNSMRIQGAACIFRAQWVSVFANLASVGVPIDIIITKGIYDKIKREYPSELETGLKYKNTHVYVCDDTHISFVVTERSLSLLLDYVNGHHDTKNDLTGTAPTAVKWGGELFNYYRANSVEVVKPTNEPVTQEPCP